MHLAAMKGHMDVVQFFTIETHCDPTCKDCDQQTPLHKATRFGSIDIVKFLILEMHCDSTSHVACSNEWAFGHSQILLL